jgi:hypothetical protein
VYTRSENAVTGLVREGCHFEQQSNRATERRFCAGKENGLDLRMVDQLKTMVGQPLRMAREVSAALDRTKWAVQDFSARRYNHKNAGSFAPRLDRLRQFK